MKSHPPTRLLKLVSLVLIVSFAWGCAQKKITKEPHAGPATPKVSKSVHAEDSPSARVSGAMKRTSEAGEAARPHPSSSPASGLRAAYADDNRQFNRFLGFLSKYKTVSHLSADVSERITLSVTDKEGLVIPNCEVVLSVGGDVVEKGKTTSDGLFRTFPALYAGSTQEITARLNAYNTSETLTLTRKGKRKIPVTLDTWRRLPDAIPLDLLFILDTTGSMGEEIQRLKTSIDLINMNLAEHPAGPLIRYGMVLYKDRGDAYITREIPFTPELEDFREELNRIKADGGGDTPEDLESALKQGIDLMQWNPDAIKLAFIITDAPPHLDYQHSFTYLDATRVAREKGIKIFSVGTGGLSLDGEYVLRQIAQLTSGAYIFLTYGERSESDGGTPGSVSHHTGTNFTSNKLEAVIIKIARNELANLTGDADITHDYFEATFKGEHPEKILDELFASAVDQLASYASISLSHKPATAILPVATTLPAVDQSHLTSTVLMAAIRHPLFTVVDRENTGAIVNEIKLGLSGLMDEASAAEAGRLTGATVLMAATATKTGEKINLILRLISVETGEVLSATRVVMDKTLLPSMW